MEREKVLEILEHNWTSLKNSAYTEEEMAEALEYVVEYISPSIETLANEHGYVVISEADYEKIYHRQEISNNSDVISRSCLRDFLEWYFSKQSEEESETAPCWWSSTEVEEKIQSYPSVVGNETRLKGEWEVDEDGNVNCPFCGMSGYGNFCSNCGADMRGEVKYERYSKTYYRDTQTDV